MDMPAGEFKAKCLKLMDDVQQYGKEIVITKYGKPVAKLVPVKEKTIKKSLFGFMKDAGKAKIKGDIFSTGVTWDAEQEEGESY